jgi:outer membrane protein assembly factor BamE (lipoprotein component of BamABCDE complex)
MLLASSGCASSTYGTRLDKAQVDRIEKGKSTRADVEALLGPCPTPVTASPDGTRMLTYAYSETQAHADIWRAFIPHGLGGTGGETIRHNQLLTIWIASDGIVKDYEFSDLTTDTTQSASIFGGGQSTTTVQPLASQTN